MEGPDASLVGEAASRRWPLLGMLAMLVGVTLLDNVVAPDAYLLWACLAIAGMTVLARADGLRHRDWGLGPITGRAAAAATVLAAVTAAAMLVGTQLPGISSAYLDERVAGMGSSEVAFASLVRVPIGTALLEEVAFRGVLLAMLSRRYGTRWGIAGSSVAFGLWHLLPSLGLTGNEAIEAAGAYPLALSVIAMTAAGLAGAFLCLLRIRYHHLVVPLAVHGTANSLAYLLAWLMLRP